MGQPEWYTEVCPREECCDRCWNRRGDEVEGETRDEHTWGDEVTIATRECPECGWIWTDV